jgi:hypothetical protein
MNRHAARRSPVPRPYVLSIHSRAKHLHAINYTLVNISDWRHTFEVVNQLVHQHGQQPLKQGAQNVQKDTDN